MLSILTILLLLALAYVLSQTQHSAMFVVEELCGLEESVRQGCSKYVDGARNLMGCTRKCWDDAGCVRASLDTSGSCVHHQLCSDHFSVPCLGTPDARRYRYMTPFCRHGTWETSTKSCSCRFGTYGERCNKYHKLCTTLLRSGHSPKSPRIILDPLEDGKHLILVHCYLYGKSHFQLRIFFNKGKTDFNRTWQEDVNGFFKPNLWLGLRPWFILGKAGLTKLTLYLRFTTNDRICAQYDDFLVAGEESNFSFTGSFVSSGCGQSPLMGQKMGDCLSPLQGVPFSSWDRDLDGNEGENCASLTGSGWWYNGGSCDNPCNILGWGLDNYSATPPAQRLRVLGLDVGSYTSLIKDIYMYLHGS